MKRTIKVFVGDEATLAGTLHYDAVGSIGFFALYPGIPTGFYISNRPFRTKSIRQH